MIFKYLAHPKFIVLFTIAVIFVSFGTGIFMVFEGWGLLDALYFTVATIMTVGYGDFTPTHEVSKVVAIVYMLLMIPALLIGVGIVSETVMDRARRSNRKKRR